MMSVEKIASNITNELQELIETFVADRFTIMDDAVIENLYADLPDIPYLKGMVKGLRRNLARRAADINIEDAYPKLNAGTMALALEQAKQQIDEDAERRPVSMPELMVLTTGIEPNNDEINKAGDSSDDDWVDNSTQPAHLLHQDLTDQHRIEPIRDIINAQNRAQELRRAGLTEKDMRALTVSKNDLEGMRVPDVKFESRVNENRAPRIDRNFRSNLSRYGIANATLADMTSNARPGGLFSADTMKHSKNKDLLLVRSPATRPREHLQLLEGTDPQYYQYMWMAFEEALKTLLADESLPDNPARHLDDELLIARFGNLTANAANIINKIGNRDFLHVENVSACIKLLTEQFPSVKLYTGDKVMEDGIWAKTWTHSTLKTSKGRFVFGNPEVDVVWQTN